MNTTQKGRIFHGKKIFLKFCRKNFLRAEIYKNFTAFCEIRQITSKELTRTPKYAKLNTQSQIFAKGAHGSVREKFIMISLKKILAMAAVFSMTVSAVSCGANTENTSAEIDTPSAMAEEASVSADNKPKLSNPDATEEAQALYEYISSVYRTKIISGQQESTWMGSDQYEFDYIYKNTGKYPAIRGLDYMNDDFEGVNKRAAEWHEKGGIVTICWHCGSDFSHSWDECMKTKIDDWDKALTEGTAEYKALIAGMDKAAEALKELKEKNIPVLWRPFHEFDGGWFWWGKGGADNFVKLWRIMYDRYTNYWELDNLIWVLGYSGNGRGYDKWYPGDEYVDIAGADSYSDGANEKLYTKVQDVAGKEMPICFHECGRIPTAKQLTDGKTDWVWFMTWHTEYITDHNDTAVLKEIYNDEYVITLDELPKLY
ncbi:MAG: glycoside hydrolase family 26 protein [Oscillospiraceae bacterium]|nr:glycoside hydrolase family 26 protein [Oscillospiraceae bacterium]